MILIAMILSLHCAQMSAQKKMIVMGGQYNDPLNEKERPSRMPSTPIYIYIKMGESSYSLHQMKEM